MTIRNTYRSEYSALINAIHRCHNPFHEAYPSYGARGIIVADVWRGYDGFERFIEHIKPKASPDLSLERIDNNEGYIPGNVEWATRKAQQRNMRTSRYSSDVQDAIAKAAEESGLALNTIRGRVDRGWPLSDLTQPRRIPPNRNAIPAHVKAANDIRNAKIIRLLEEGHTRRQIGVIVGLSHNRVGKIIMELRK
ncbi:hypothetical protein C8J25_101844 [Sphingomonas faeni]|uniref:Uncharacterized protein n=1 Tax=Sphingomonas faeni TaxID=185950 RepID=A0A2T5UCV5_9SPHN|nr:hypothetical protein [Sphingomonas faeni]PTW49336.1 hypothetical protein C8J25_101844 [Sphingomonas faeni]